KFERLGSTVSRESPPCSPCPPWFNFSFKKIFAIRNRGSIVYIIGLCAFSFQTAKGMKLMSTRFSLPALAAALLGLVAAPHAPAACCYFSAKNTDILQPAQKVF